jgi:hypothetical protein
MNSVICRVGSELFTAVESYSCQLVHQAEHWGGSCLGLPDLFVVAGDRLYVAWAKEPSCALSCLCNDYQSYYTALVTCTEAELEV